METSINIHKSIALCFATFDVVNVAQEFESLLASLKKEAGLMPGEAVSGLEDEPDLADLSLLDERLDVGTGAVH